MEIKLNSDNLIAQAMEQAGLEDFGGRTFEEGLNALVESLNTDLDLGEGNAGYFQQQIVQLLTNRLEVTRLIKEYPEIEQERIERPVFILGLPRSGTSILHTLLALDPGSRYLRNFETTGPICPPPELIPESVDPRIQACHEAMEGFFSMAPVLRGINGINFMAQGPAECQNLMAHEFVHMGWSTGSSLFSHGSWVAGCDMKAAFQWHRRLLQVLQWKMPCERWILKAPMHLFGLESLLETYPDAQIIFTHRDPFDAMASGMGMVYHWTMFTTSQADPEAISKWYPGLWAKGLKRALAVREKSDESLFADVFHHELSGDLMKTVQDLYGKLDIRFSNGAKKRMETWLRDHPRSSFGIPAGMPGGGGLIPEKDLFSFYLEKFDL